MTTPVPKCLQCTNVANTTIGISTSGDNLFQSEFNIIGAGTGSPAFQFYNVGGSVYTLQDVTQGMWIAGTLGGFAWKILQVIAGNSSGDDPQQNVTLILQDEGNYNFNADTGGGSGGMPVIGESHIIFQLNTDGMPIISPIYGQYYDPKLIQLTGDLVGRFNDRLPARQYIDIYQPGNTFAVGDILWFNKSTEQYEKVSGENTQYAIGVVSNTGVPDTNNFGFKVFGTYYANINDSFSSPTGSLSISNISGVTAGSVLYIDTTGTNQYTTVAPATYAIPIWIYLGKDALTNKDTGILYPFVASGTGGGGGGGAAGTQITGDNGAPTIIPTSAVGDFYIDYETGNMYRRSV